MSRRTYHLFTMPRNATHIILSFCLILSLIPTAVVNAAENNRLIVTSMPPSVDKDTSFTIYIKSYSVTKPSIGTASGTVTFPSNLLRLKGTSPSGSAYGSPSITPGNGVINFSASVNPAPSSAIAQVFSIEFQAIAAGNATVGFGGNSRVNNETTDYVVGSVKVNDPNPPSSSSPVATPKASAAPSPVVVAPATPSIATPTNDTQPVATPDPTGLIDTVVVDPLYTSATINWKVNVNNPTATITYGTSVVSMDKKVDAIKKPDGSFSAKINDVLPGVRYYYVITGSGDGGKSGTYSDTITTLGFPVTMTITENNVPAKNARIKVQNRSYISGSDGKKTIGLAAGEYSVTISTDTASVTKKLTVATKDIPTDGTTPVSQPITYALTSSPLDQAPGSETSLFTFIGILLGGTVILGLGFVGFMAYRRRRFESGSFIRSSSSGSSTVVIDDGYDWRNQNTPQSSVTPVGQDAYTVAMQTHTNSVHITDDEPLDMFEQAQQRPSQPNSKITTPEDSHESQQTPN